MRILFMGTPDFARESLEAIYNAGHDIIGIVTNPDKPKGRGMKLAPSPVKEFGIEKNICVYQPNKIRNNEEIINQIRELNPDVICVVAYGKILPKEILDIPKKGCINVHGSLLPKYRGAAPIQWAVLNGETVTGITTMYMDVGMDTGDIILKHEVQIGENETTGELWNRLAVLGGQLLVKTLEQIENGTAKREKQGSDFSLAPMLDKSIAKIDWENQSAKKIKNLIRGLNPIMGAYSFLDGKKIKFWRAEVIEEEEFLEKYGSEPNVQAKANGTVLKSDSKIGLFIKAKYGILKITEIQGENAKKMPIQDFLRGNKIEENKIFS